MGYPTPTRCIAWDQHFLGAEPDNALPDGQLTLNRLPPIPLPIRTPGFRHRLVLRMSLDESCPGIQLSMACKTGDLLTVTLNERLV